MPKGDGNRHPFHYEGMTPNLAYLVGVYMGDGYCEIRLERYGYFRVAVVDMDFLLEVQRKAFDVLGFRSRIHFNRIAKNENCRDRYVITICSSQFALWLVDITGKKKFIPLAILESTKDIQCAFVQGLMDSEACIMPLKMDDQGRKRPGRILFGVKSDWINDVWDLCVGLGAKPSPISSRSGFYRFSIIPRNYSEAGLTFNITRKREMLYEAITPYRRKQPVYKGPHKPPIQGSNSHLCDEDVKEIRKLIKVRSFGTLAKMYQVSEATIRRIVQGKTFRHLLGEDQDTQE